MIRCPENLSRGSEDQEHLSLARGRESILPVVCIEVCAVSLLALPTDLLEL